MEALSYLNKYVGLTIPAHTDVSVSEAREKRESNETNSKLWLVIDAYDICNLIVLIKTKTNNKYKRNTRIFQIFRIPEITSIYSHRCQP